MTTSDQKWGKQIYDNNRKIEKNSMLVIAFTSQANDVHVDWHLSLESSAHPHRHQDDQELYFACNHHIEHYK